MLKKNFNVFLLFLAELFFKKISPKFQVDKLKNFMDCIYVLFEKIAFSLEVLHPYYLKFYEELVEKEINMAEVTSEDKILVIGCGSLPATSIIIVNKTHAKTVSIDVDPEAVDKAVCFIRQHHLQSFMKCECADGLSYPISSYDVIFVLYGIKQQKEILKYISQNMKDNARIIYRTTEDVLKNVLGGHAYLSDLFIIRDCVHSDIITQNDSYLLLKKKQ